MTELEARDLKVGDMVLYYSPNAHDSHVYVEEKWGKFYAVDMGLVLENDGERVRIDWFAEDANSCEFQIEYEIWDHVKKV